VCSRRGAIQIHVYLYLYLGFCSIKLQTVGTLFVYESVPFIGTEEGLSCQFKISPQSSLSTQHYVTP